MRRLLNSAVWIILSFLLSIHVFAETYFLQTKRLSFTPESSGGWITVDSEDTIHVVWKEINDNVTFYYTKSEDGGRHWSSQKRLLTWPAGYSSGLSIFSDSNNHLYLFIEYDNHANDHGEIYFMKSEDRGESWTEPKKIYPGKREKPVYYLNTALDLNNNLYVTWGETIVDRRWIYFLKSTDGGESWTEPRVLFEELKYGQNPHLAVDLHNHLHATCDSGEIFYIKSEDGGETWSETRMITWSGYYSAVRPKMVVDRNNHLHLVYYRYTLGEGDAWYTKSTDGGKSWSSAQNITQRKNVGFPDVVVDEKNYLHLVWQDSGYPEPTFENIYYLRSEDGGETWIELKNLTEDFRDQGCYDQRIASDSHNQVHIIWRYNVIPGGGPNNEIFYTRTVEKKKGQEIR